MTTVDRGNKGKYSGGKLNVKWQISSTMKQSMKYYSTHTHTHTHTHKEVKILLDNWYRDSQIKFIKQNHRTNQ